MLYTLRFRKVVTSLQEVTVEVVDHLDALGFANLFATAHDYNVEPLYGDVTEIEVLLDLARKADADAVATYKRYGEEI